MINKGSIGVVVKSKTTNQRRVLTASHVVLLKPPNGVITQNLRVGVSAPGRSDLAAMMHTAFEKYKLGGCVAGDPKNNLQALLDEWNAPARAFATAGRIGFDTTPEAWREDWGLIDFSGLGATPVNEWHDEVTVSTFVSRVRQLLPGDLIDPSELRVTEIRNPADQEEIFTDGCVSKMTFGKVYENSDALTYEHNTIDGIPSNTNGTGDVCLHWTLEVNDGNQAWGPGDSGSGVYGVGINGGIAFVGLLVSVETREGRPNIGLFVPAEIVMAQIKKMTKTEWELAP